jgi:toxin-antitoxin system PIN domain toxin
VIVPDVNLLVYAYVRGLPQHERARRWWEDVMNADREVGVAAPALFGFLRLVTNRRVVRPPLAMDAALAHVEDWVSLPHVLFLVPGPRHLELAFALLRETRTAGDMTTDVQLAALALEHGGEVHSTDTDFGRFPRLRWVNPLR